MTAKDTARGMLGNNQQGFVGLDLLYAPTRSRDQCVLPCVSVPKVLSVAGGLYGSQQRWADQSCVKPQM